MKTMTDFDIEAENANGLVARVSEITIDEGGFMAVRGTLNGEPARQWGAEQARRSKVCFGRGVIPWNLSKRYGYDEDKLIRRVLGLVVKWRCATQ